MSGKERELRERAVRVPSGNLEEDLDCLSQLIILDGKYFEFVLSRLRTLISDPEAIRRCQQLALSEIQEYRFLALFELVLNNIDSERAVEWIVSLLFTAKGMWVSYAIMLNSNLPKFSKKLAEKLFEIVPKDKDNHVITVRDTLFFQIVNTPNGKNLGIECLMKIPVTLRRDFYREFLTLAGFLIESKKYNDTFIGLLQDVASVVDDPEGIMSLLSENQELKVCEPFANWASSWWTGYEKLQSEKFEELASLPPLIRRYALEPIDKNVNGPRLCRIFREGKIDEDKLLDRIITEQDPKMVHDYLIARGKYASLPEDLPFRFTLLAVSARIYPSEVGRFVSEFMKLPLTADPALQLAAAKGLEIVARRSSNVLTQVFPRVREMLKRGSKATKNHLLNAIGFAVCSRHLEAKFIWRAYHSIRTLPEDYQDLSNVIHYLVSAMNDPDEREIAVPVVKDLCETNVNEVTSALFRFPIERLPVKELLPRQTPRPLTRPQIFHDLIMSAFDEELTTCRKLQLATAFSAYWNYFDKETTGWIRCLTKAGKCVFNLKIDEPLLREVRVNMHENEDGLMRFASVFAVALFLSYKLIEGRDLVDSLCQCINDSSSCVRLLSWYALSMCTVDDPEQLILGGIQNARKRSAGPDDFMGIGYCIEAWFVDMIPLLRNKQKRTELENIPFLWPFIADICSFINEPVTLREDALSQAQYIYLHRNDVFMKKEAEKLMEENPLREDVVMTAICGYVPSRAFLMTNLPDQQETDLLLRASQRLESGRLYSILTTERLCHTDPSTSDKAVGTQRRAATERIKTEWKTLPRNDLAILLDMSSESEIKQLISAEKEYSVVVAVERRRYEDVAHLLSVSKWDKTILAMIKELMGRAFPDIISSMLENNAPDDMLARILTYFRYNELLSDANMLAMLPVLLAEIELSALDVATVCKTKKSWLKEFLHCLILTRPELIESDVQLYQYFHN